VIHAAAQKHLPQLESAPCAAAWTNVLGTRHVAAAADACGAERFVYVSTDKAARPSSVMGASKRIGEEIVRAANLRSRTRFVTVRFGNVIGSSNSVVPIFQEQIAARGPVAVTHPDVSRYFMTRSEAAALLLHAAHGTGSDLLVLDMGSPIRIVDLARYLIRLAGLVPGFDVEITFIGLRPGEKLHEDLLGPGERARRDHPAILSVHCPRSVAGLEPALRDLAEAVRLKDDARALDLLRHLAPGYGPRAEPPSP
jgi:FlaA1/EpsC-like NDP-sugar epimerase